MKRKTRLTLLALSACAAMSCVGIAAGCSETDLPTLDDYQPNYPPVAQAPDGDSITLDGKLDESIYTDGSLKWLDLTTTGTGDEGLASTAVNVKATSAYGAEGFYLAFDVSHTPVYVDLDHNRASYYDSCMEIYLGFPGVSALEHSYQIDIAPDGNINVQKHNGNYFMDFYLTDGLNRATVKGGEINTDDANGYVMEVYFPWKMFGFDEALAAIQMDVAVIVSSREDANGRDGWDSLGMDHKEGYGWGVPSTYWHWGTNGLEDSKLILSVADYDKERGSVSFAQDAYKAYDDVKINVTPAAGNILKSLKVNGVDRTLEIEDNVLTLSAYAGKQKVEVVAEFIARPADLVTVSGTVTQFAGTAQMNTEGKYVYFRSDEGAYQAKITSGGGYTVDLMKGEYTVAFADCADLTVEITQASDSKNLVFYYQLFGEDNVNEISADQSTLTTGTAWQDTVLNVGDKFVLDYTVKFKSGVTWDGGDDNFGFGYYTIGNKHYIFDHYIQGGWDYESIRDVADFWGTLIAPNKNLAAGANAVYNYSQFEEGIPFRLIRVEDNFYWYIKTQDGDYNLIHQHTALGDISKMTLTVWGSTVLAFDLVEIGYSDVMPEVTITAQSNNTELGTVDAPEKSQFGVPTTVTFTPAENCLLARVTVNGVDKTGDVSNNTLVFLPDDFNCLVEVGFISESDQTYKVTGTLTATAGKSGVWNVPKGTELTFTGATGSEQATVGENGTYTVALKAGAYTVTATNYIPFTISVEGESTIDKQIVYDLLKDGQGNVSADETTATSTAWAVVNVNIPSEDKWVFTCTMKTAQWATWKCALQLYDGSGYIEFGIVNSNEGLRAGIGVPNDPDYILANGIVFSEENSDEAWVAGYKFAIVRDGDVFTAYLQFADGKYHGVGSTTIRNFTQFHLQFHDAANEYHDLSLTLGTTELDVEFAEVNVSGTLTATAGASEPWAVPQGTVVTFSRNGEEDVQATVGENGSYTAALKYGIYTVTANGYKGKLNVAGETANGSLVYDLLKDGQGTVSDDETTATSAAWAVVNVNIPTEDKWVFTCTMTTAQWATWKFTIQLYDGSKYIDFGIVDSDDGLKAGVGVPDGADYIRDNGIVILDKNSDEAWAAGFKFAIVRDGDLFTAYLQYEDGKYHEIGSTTISDFKQFHLQFQDASNEYHDLSLTLGTTDLDNVYVDETTPD